MVSVSTGLLAGYTTAALLTLPFVWLFWRQDVRGNRFMAAIMVGAFFTTVTYTGSLVADGLQTTLVWYYVYLATLSVNAMLFTGLALVWTNRESLVRLSVFVPVTLALAAIPLLGLVGLVAAGETLSPLIWADPGLTDVGSLSVFDRTPGPLALVWRLGATGAVLVSLVLLGSFTIRPEQRLYRKQNALMLAGALSVTILAIAAQLVGVPVEVTPMAYILTATIFAVAITGFGYFDVVPLATNSIVEELDAGVLVYGTGGRVLDANRTASEMLGVPCEPGTDLTDLAAEAPVFGAQVADAERLDALEEALDGHEFTTEEERRISASVSEVRGPSDAVVGNGLLMYDVTERHRREQRLERQKKQLDQFASVVSHDLRNPLGIARTYLDFARETGDDEDFEAVDEALDRMDAMIDELLTMARADTMVEDPDSVLLSDLASAAWETAQTDGATLTTHLDDATVEGDPDLLRNVFENLFRNAVDHNDTPLTVTIGTVDGNPGGFYVADDGTGIPPEERDAVFDHGYTTSTDGVGLGLAIVSELVEAHGWEISVGESESGGARFEVRTG